jgi:hypothetical protein
MVVAPACATKKFVRTEVGNSKVDTLSTSVETTQERTRQNETRIGVVDAKADAAGRSAVEAGRTAAEAGTAAGAAVNATKEVDGRPDRPRERGGNQRPSTHL